MGAAFDRLKVSTLLVLVGGYLTLGYSFMLLRIPPTGFGIPLGELLLVLVLVGINPRLALSRMGAVVLLAPFLIWWGWGLGRLVFDAAEHGIWALRDATPLIESLFLIVGFSLASDPRAVQRLARWLRPIIIISSLYGLLFVFADQIAAVSPTISGASGQAVPIFGSFAMAGTMLLWAAFACLIAPAERPNKRLILTLMAGFLIAFALIVLQKRTSYLQLAGLAALLLYVQPRALGRLGITLPILAFLLLVIAAFDFRVAGRLTSEISLSFFLDHILAIVGIGAEGQGNVADAAEGVSLRLHWWSRLYEQLTSDAIALIGGLGYGIPLTDFHDTLGVVTREPHNSVVSVVARLGLIGLVSWTWMQVEFFRAGFRAYRACRRQGRDDTARLILLLIAFAILTLVGCVGEDNMEKPFFAIPFYTFWGFVLRIAYRLRTETQDDYSRHLAGDAPPAFGTSVKSHFNARRMLILLLIAGTAIFGISGSAARASDDVRTIEKMINEAGPGATVIIQPGKYRVSDLEIPPGLILYAPKGATIIGNLTARGPETVIRGFTLQGGMIDISNSRSVSIGECVFRGGETAIKVDDAREALIVNNEFYGVSGGVITGWGVDRSTISGNHFFDCGQCINLAFNNDRKRGRSIVVERNIFRGTARMPVEVGPIGAYTENLIVRDNWAEEFKNRGPDPGDTMSTFVAYSLVPTHGVGTVITGNYAIAGSRGRGDIGIELDGSGIIAGNHIEDFRFGAIVYGAGFDVRDNLFFNTKEAVVLNYANRPGQIALNGKMQRITRHPERRDWPCRQPRTPNPAVPIAWQEHFRLPDWPCD